MQDAGMHHANIVHYLMAGLKEVLQQEQSLIDTPVTVYEAHKHVANVV